MTKPVTGLTTWGAATTGSTADLDDNFSALQDAVNDFNTYKNFLTDNGAASSMTVTLPANITGPLEDGLLIQVKVASNNTGSTTLNYNGTGAANVINLDGTDLVANQIVANAIVSLQYSNSVSAWFLQTPVKPKSGWVLLSAQQANGSNTINFNNSISSTYDQYRLTVTGAVPSGNNATMSVRLGTGNVPTYQGANYTWSGTVGFSNSGTQVGISSTGNSADGAFLMTRDVTGIYNGANGTISGEIQIASSPDANRYVEVNLKTSYLTSTFQAASVVVGGMWQNANTVTSVQVLPSNGNIQTGNFALYGMVKS